MKISILRNASVFFLAFLGFTVISNAQTSHLGIRLGASLSKWETNKDDREDENVTGFNLAIPIEARVSNNFAIQPEFNFIQKGTIGKFNGGTRTVTTVTNYLEVPILLKAILGSEKAHLYVNGGPSVGFVTSTKSTTEDNGFLFTSRSEYQSGSENKLSYGLAMGGGLGVGMGSGAELNFDFRYLYGLSDFSKNEDVKITDKGFALGIGLMFPF